MRVFNEYVDKIWAIQWDGSDELLFELGKELYQFVKAWKVDGTTPPSPNSLRLNNIQYQGDHWANIGDYIILDEMPDGGKKVRTMTKEKFDKIYFRYP